MKDAARECAWTEVGPVREGYQEPVPPGRCDGAIVWVHPDYRGGTYFCEIHGKWLKECTPFGKKLKLLEP